MSRPSHMTGRAIELYAQGWSTRQIGAELGRDHSCIARWLRRAGVQMRPQAPRPMSVDTALIIRLRDQDGLTFRPDRRASRDECAGRDITLQARQTRSLTTGEMQRLRSVRG